MIARADTREIQPQLGALADGEATPGERLPPARDMAAVLGVNTNTVLRACASFATRACSGSAAVTEYASPAHPNAAPSSQPISGAGVARAALVAAENCILNVDASDPEELRLGKRVVTPDNDPRLLDRHAAIFDALPDSDATDGIICLRETGSAERRIGIAPMRSSEIPVTSRREVDCRVHLEQTDGSTTRGVRCAPLCGRLPPGSTMRGDAGAAARDRSVDRRDP